MDNIVQQGGIMMYPLLFISILALAIIMERFIKYLRMPQEVPDDLMEDIKENILKINTRNH